jgi:nucleotide-binding universal stress UspA family protein
MNNILSKFDNSVAAFLSANDVTAYPAKRASQKELPFAVVFSSKATPIKDAPFAGCYDVTLTVAVKSEILNEDGAVDASNQLFDTVADLLVPGGNNHRDGTQVARAIEAEAHSNNIEITIEEVTIESIEAEPAENHWRDTITMTARCYPSVIE